MSRAACADICCSSWDMRCSMCGEAGWVEVLCGVGVGRLPLWGRVGVTRVPVPGTSSICTLADAASGGG